MEVSLFYKTAEEAVEVLANKYAEKQIKQADDKPSEKSKTDAKAGAGDQAARAIIGGVAGAGLGGLGTLGYNYLKGKKTKLKDVLYGSLMGAVPGASLGYLTGSDGLESKPQPAESSNMLAAITGHTLLPAGVTGLGALISGKLGLNNIVGSSAEQRRLLSALNSAPDLKTRKNIQQQYDLALKDTSKNVLVNPINSKPTSINANLARRGLKGLSGLGALATLYGFIPKSSN